MTVETEKELAMRCPRCGKHEYHRISRFSAGTGKSLNINCSCGAVKFVIETRNRSDYRLKIACAFCDDYHSQTMTGKRIWSSDEIINFCCHDTGFELGHMGSGEKVRKITSGRERELEILVSEFGRDGFFHNSKIMYEILRCIHQIAERDDLYCQCGNSHIEVEIFPDRLELQCADCGSINIIYAETEDDLAVVRQVEEIELVRNGFEYLDSLVRAGKNKKNRYGKEQ
ncbi:MAG: hypothetical protein ACOY31_06965 [Bacillota bacterium]